MVIHKKIIFSYCPPLDILVLANLNLSKYLLFVCLRAGINICGWNISKKLLMLQKNIDMKIFFERKVFFFYFHLKSLFIPFLNPHPQDDDDFGIHSKQRE